MSSVITQRWSEQQSSAVLLWTLLSISSLFSHTFTPLLTCPLMQTLSVEMEKPLIIQLLSYPFIHLFHTLFLSSGMVVHTRGADKLGHKEWRWHIFRIFTNITITACGSAWVWTTSPALPRGEEEGVTKEKNFKLVLQSELGMPPVPDGEGSGCWWRKDAAARLGDWREAGVIEIVLHSCVGAGGELGRRLVKAAPCQAEEAELNPINRGKPSGFYAGWHTWSVKQELFQGTCWVQTSPFPISCLLSLEFLSLSVTRHSTLERKQPRPDFAPHPL